MDKRRKAYKEGTLPYSFNYKIVKAFYGKECPICKCKMGIAIRSDDDPVVVRNPIPTIQHNIPIAKGGKHSIENISVICRKCNSSIQDHITVCLNNLEVRKEWELING